MGSEMCIRDSGGRVGSDAIDGLVDDAEAQLRAHRGAEVIGRLEGCLLYTSDAAHERSSVDLGGRRIIKKKHAL